MFMVALPDYYRKICDFCKVKIRNDPKFGNVKKCFCCQLTYIDIGIMKEIKRYLI